MVWEGRGGSGGVYGTGGTTMTESAHDRDLTGCHNGDRSALIWRRCGYSLRVSGLTGQGRHKELCRQMVRPSPRQAQQGQQAWYRP